MIKCPCGRPFVTGYSYVEHAFLVHGTDDQAKKVPKIKHKGKFEVPYLTVSGGAGVAQKSTSGYTDDHPKGSKGNCTECSENEDPANLPLHPGCDCEPVEGWEDYINNAKKPDNWTKKQWDQHLQDLREAHDVDAPDED